MKHCPNCSLVFTAQTKFCPDCGRQLQQAPQVTSSPTSSSNANSIAGVPWQPPVVSQPAPQQQAFVSSAPKSPPNLSHLSLTPDKADAQFEGEVQDFQQRTEQTIEARSTNSGGTTFWGNDPVQHVTITWHVWTFRVVRYDAQGNALPPIPVEMRSTSFEGGIKDGDIVRVPYAWQAGQIIKAERVYNLTTSSNAGIPVPVKGNTSLGGFLIGLGIFLFVLGCCGASSDPSNGGAWFSLGFIFGLLILCGGLTVLFDW